MSTAEVVSVAGASMASASPSVTFSGYVPQQGDLVVLFAASSSALVVVADSLLPSGWVNPLGDGVEVNAGTSCGMAAIYHVVTEAEESAATLTYTATNALADSENGHIHGVAIRSANASTPIDGSGTALSEASATPHVLAGITGDGVLLDGSLVISSVGKDATGDYGAVAPAGWTRLLNTDTNVGQWTGTRDAFTVADANVDATNITPSASDQYTSITLAITASDDSGSTRSHTYRNLQLLAG